MRQFTFKTLFALIGCMGLTLSAQAQLVLTIEKALEYSIENSPDLKNSLMNLERSQASLDAQHASLKSQFSLDLNPITYSQNRYFETYNSNWYTNKTFATSGTFKVIQPIIWTDATLSLTNRFGWQNSDTDKGSGNVTNRAFSNDLSLRLSQPLFKYNQTKMDLKNLELDYENALIRYAIQRLNTEKGITESFYRVYMLQNDLDISKSEYENSKINYEIIKNKVEADLSTKDELYQAELNLANSSSTVENTIVSLENAKDNLKKLLGLEIRTDVLVMADVEIDSIYVDPDKAVEYALSNRLELRQREITRMKEEFNMTVIKETNSLNGSVDLSIGITGDNEKFGNIYEKPTNNPRIAVEFSVPIFDWGERKKRIKAQQLSIDMVDLQIREEIKDIEINVRSTCRSIENYLRQIKIAQKSIENAQLTYDLNAERYRNGDLTGMEMNQFQTQLSSKKSQYSSAVIEYKVALLALKILTLYDYEKSVQLMPLQSFENKK